MSEEILKRNVFFRNIILTLIVCLITVAVSIALSSEAGLVEEKIMGQIRRAYAGVCADCRFEFSGLRIPAVDGRELEDLRVITDTVAWQGSFLLPLEARDRRIGWVSGQVRIFRRGPVARRALRPNEPLSENEVEERWVDVTFSKDQLASREDLAQMTPRRFIGVRQPVMKGDLRKSFVVQRGQTVKATSGGDLFEVATRMRAEEPGAVGDLIRVKNLETQKILSARVASEGTVRIE